MTNPFAGLTEEQHCKGNYAVNWKNHETDPTAPESFRWCAIGALQRAELTKETTEAFSVWFQKKYFNQLWIYNDAKVNAWTFAQFAAAWDQWRAEVGE